MPERPRNLKAKVKGSFLEKRYTEPGWEEGELGLVEKQKRKGILDRKEQSYRM